MDCHWCIAFCARRIDSRSASVPGPRMHRCPLGRATACLKGFRCHAASASSLVTHAKASVNGSLTGARRSGRTSRRVACFLHRTRLHVCGVMCLSSASTLHVVRCCWQLPACPGKTPHTAHQPQCLRTPIRVYLACVRAQFFSIRHTHMRKVA